jgi:hypothetical protein
MKVLVEAREGIKVVLIRTPEGKAKRVFEKMAAQENRGSRRWTYKGRSRDSAGSG